MEAAQVAACLRPAVEATNLSGGLTVAKPRPVHYTVILTDEVKAKLHGMPLDLRREVGHKLFLLEDGFSGNVKKLKGSEKEYRLRVGNYRVLFELENRTITVYAVGNRKDIYR